MRRALPGIALEQGPGPASSKRKRSSKRSTLGSSAKLTYLKAAMDLVDLAEIEAFVGIETILAGKYRIERLLGVGGMGAVVEARHEKLGEKVAIKFLLPRQGANLRLAARFLQEARTASKLRSAHVARVFDIDSRSDGTPYIVMEYLHGETLASRFRREGQREIAGLADEVLETCVAVAEAHALGVVHRDLKPANLFLAEGARGVVSVRVLDFGISKVIAPSGQPLDSVTGGSPIGSPPYMSPEQFAEPASVDHRTDLWSLGVVLYEGLAGRLPFSGDTFASICTNVLQRQPPELGSLRDDVPAELAAVVEKCLAKETSRRFSTVEALARSLAPFGSDRGRRALALIDEASRSPESAAPALDPSSRSAAPTVTALDISTLSAAAKATQSPGERVESTRRPLLVLAGLLALAVIVGTLWTARLQTDAPASDSTAGASVTALGTDARTSMPSGSALTVVSPPLAPGGRSDAEKAPRIEAPRAERPRPSTATKRPRALPVVAPSAAPTAAGSSHKFDPVFDERR